MPETTDVFAKGESACHPLAELFDEPQVHLNGPDAVPDEPDRVEARLIFLQRVEDLLQPLFDLPAGHLAQYGEHSEAMCDTLEECLWDARPDHYSGADDWPANEFRDEFGRALEILREHLLGGQQ